MKIMFLVYTVGLKICSDLAKTFTVKCIIGSSWCETSHLSGAAWILRDDAVSVVLHSRRAFSQTGSNREVELKDIS